MHKAFGRRCLVTGGAGFLGSHLCERLLDLDCEVLCIDNFDTGTKQNIQQLQSHPSFELLRHDISFPLYVEVDAIFNLARPASPIHHQFDPVQTTNTSVMGTINMLGLAKRLKVPILHASTSEVYGDPTTHPPTEGHWGNVNRTGLRAYYDEGKRCAETLFFDYHRQHNLHTKVARIFNTYGPRMHPNDGRVVSNFIVQALKGEPLTVYGDGSQTRSFCYVGDLVEGLVRFMDAPSSLTGPINLGNRNELTTTGLAQRVIDLTGAQSSNEYAALPQDDPTQRQPDLGVAGRELSWEPQVNLTNGLVKTISYFERLLSERGELEGRVWGPQSRQTEAKGHFRPVEVAI